MIAIGAALAALLFACWILFTLAVYALPFFVAVSAGMFAYQTGSGAFAAFIIGLLTGCVALVLGQTLFSATRSPVLRAVIAAAYAAPAAFAGYHMMHGLATIGSPSPGWHELLSVAGAIVIGVVAWNRMGALARSEPGGSSSGQTDAYAVQAHRRS